VLFQQRRLEQRRWLFLHASWPSVQRASRLVLFQQRRLEQRRWLFLRAFSLAVSQLVPRRRLEQWRWFFLRAFSLAVSQLVPRQQAWEAQQAQAQAAYQPPEEAQQAWLPLQA
jgi:hypothetical protein